MEGLDGGPFFLVAHFFDAHWPYEPPEDVGVPVANPYEGEVTFVWRSPPVAGDVPGSGRMRSVSANAIGNDELHRIRQAVGAPVVALDRVHRGYANNHRWLATLADESRVFVKHADDPTTARWLRREHTVYGSLHAALRPDELGWFDDGELPVLVLEDLSDCFWPPPWTADHIGGVVRALRELAKHPLIDDLPPGSQAPYAERGWPAVAQDPEPFLALRVCSRAWLEGALPTLQRETSPDHLDGDSLVHLDVRSDNLCFRADGSVVFVDWNLAAIGNPEFDLAFWLPSLRLEGGPEPWEMLPDPTPGVVVMVAGFFASRACLPFVPAAPLVREFQLRQLEIALPWAARVLGLPDPRG